MSDPALRAALFRFVDVRPACATPARRHPPPARAALRRAGRLRPRPPRGRHLRPQARHPPRRRDRRDRRQADGAALHRRRRRQGLAADDHRAVEATASTPPSTCSARPPSPRPRPTATPSAARTRCARSRQPPRSTRARRRPRVNLSVKVSALTPLLRPEAPERGIEGARPRLRHLLRVARDVGAHLHVDMESFDTREAITRLTLDLLSEPEFAAGPSAGIVLQAYLVDSPEYLEELLDWARANPRAHPFTIRLVKGAYWDHEVVQAAQHGWAPPVFTDRRACDRNFEALSQAPDRRDADRPRRDRLAQPALDLRGRRLRRRPRRRQRRPRVPDPARARRRHPGRDRRHRPPRPRLLPGRRPRRRAWPTSCAACSRTPPTTPSSPPHASGTNTAELLEAP